jgi:hypothetical protein
MPSNVNVSISDLTVANGHAPDGKHGAAGSGGGGDGESGGGIRNIKGTLSLQNCRVVDNSAGDYDIAECDGYGGDGGGIYSQGTLLMDRCTICTDGNCADCCGVLNSRGDNLIENIKGCDTIDNDTPPDNPGVI